MLHLHLNRVVTAFLPCLCLCLSHMFLFGLVLQKKHTAWCFICILIGLQYIFLHSFLLVSVIHGLVCFVFSQKRDTYGAWEHYLGLEHTDSTPKRSHTSNQVLLHLFSL
jgi:hypothetical protein